MAIGEFRIRINNRKVLKGLLHHCRIPEERSAAVLRALDKVEKEEASRILAELERGGLSAATARELYDLIAVRKDTKETLAALGALAAKSDILQAGLEELRNVVDAMRLFGVAESAFSVDLSVVRGLDYYTGTIYETQLVGHPDLGSICSGGRYDDLASYFTNTKLPGVGISIGLTRLFSKLRELDVLPPAPRTPAEALIITMDVRYLGRYLEMARMLRAAGVNTEVYLETAKVTKQFEYADKKGFRLAVVAGQAEFDNDVVQIKNLGTQQATSHPIGNLVVAVQNSLGASASLERP
jgi:histidyl-tRNA synthetase